MSETNDDFLCTQCGMHTQPKEYHPYAACLMFIACKDANVVRANLKDVVAYNDKRLRDGIRALADSFEEHSAAYNAMWKDGYSQYYEGRSDQAEVDCSALRALLREGGE